jgi:hypothetical protein
LHGFLLYQLVILCSDLIVGILREIIVVVDVANSRSRSNFVVDVLLERGFSSGT